MQEHAEAGAFGAQASYGSGGGSGGSEGGGRHAGGTAGGVEEFHAIAKLTGDAVDEVIGQGVGPGEGGVTIGSRPHGIKRNDDLG